MCFCLRLCQSTNKQKKATTNEHSLVILCMFVWFRFIFVIACAFLGAISLNIQIEFHYYNLPSSYYVSLWYVLCTPHQIIFFQTVWSIALLGAYIHYALPNRGKRYPFLPAHRFSSSYFPCEFHFGRNTLPP